MMTVTTKQFQFQLNLITAGQTRTITIPDASTTIVGTDATQTLTNKTLIDNTTFFQDNTTSIKQMQFELANLTAGITRKLTIPDASTTILGTDVTQTLTNKSLNDTVTTFQNSNTNTKKMQFLSSGITAGQTRIYTCPDYNGNLICSSNAASSNYTLLSNGTQISWSQLGISCLGDFNMSSVSQGDNMQANVTLVNAITTSTGVYTFSSNIANKTLVSSNSTFTRIVYGNKYVALDNNTLMFLNVVKCTLNIRQMVPHGQCPHYHLKLPVLLYLLCGGWARTHILAMGAI